MARLYIDQREIELPAPVFRSLDQVLRHVEESHLAPNTLIREIQVDGQPLGSEAFQENPSRILEHIAERDRIEIFTGTVWDIARDSIREAVDYLGRVETISPDLALAFRASPGPDAFDRLKQFYDGFYWLNLLLDRLQTTFQLTLESVHVDGVSVRNHHLNLVSLLKELIGAQERQDFVLLADLLEYEIQPLIPLWRSVFTALGERIVAA
jgi:hypothetical protein